MGKQKGRREELGYEQGFGDTKKSDSVANATSTSGLISQLQPVVRIRRLEQFIEMPGNVRSPTLLQDTTTTIGEPPTRNASTGKLPRNCNECGKTFPTNWKLEERERAHTGEKPYSCELCSKSFSTKGSLKTHHVRHTTEGKSHKCATCSKLLATTASLRVHRESHLATRSYNCGICLKSFTTGSNLARHRRTHSGGKQLSCTFCENVFTSQHALDRHIRVHTGEKPFPCTLCRARFYSAGELTKHIKANHLDPVVDIVLVKPHRCDVCQRRFTAAHSLSSHKLTQHSTEPPAYTCDKCGRTFKTRHCLRIHLKRHSLGKSQTCFFCPLAVRTQGELHNHIKLRHTGEKPYACRAEACDSRFCSKKMMTRHYKRSHQ